MAGNLAQHLGREEISEVVKSFEGIISASFVVHPMRHMTELEIKRRFDMLVEIFCYLRGDMKWSLTRILDQIPIYLGDELNGNEWKPSVRSIWTPADGAA